MQDGLSFQKHHVPGGALLLCSDAGNTGAPAGRHDTAGQPAGDGLGGCGRSPMRRCIALPSLFLSCCCKKSRCPARPARRAAPR